MPPDERETLDALMAEQGITRLGGRPRRGAAATPPVPRPAPSAETARAEQQAAATSAGLRAELAEAVAGSAALRAELAQAVATGAALQAELAAAAAVRDVYDQERRALSRKLTERPPAPARFRVTEALAARGLAQAEHADVLASLLLEIPDVTLAALDDPSALTELLDDQLVLACGASRCRLEVRGAVYEVSAERCELCGGSDIAAAYRRFASACADRGFERIVIIGGSPSYRRQLQLLAQEQGGRLKLQLVDGTSRPQARKVKSMGRTADLVVTWCATILDHATTNAFEASGAPMVRVPHRGIARMLGWLADHLDR